MADSASTFLILAITGLSGAVSSMAVYIWKQEVDRRKAAEAKLAEYEQPAREATAELLRLVNEKRRQEALQAKPEGAGDAPPWPWSEVQHPASSASRPGRGTRRQGSS